MAEPNRPRDAPRVPLSRERVLHAALALADETGVESLSMRRLAKTLGVEAMSLYNHVGNKDDLLDGLVDLVFDEIEPPPSDVDWRTAMRRRAISTREALRRHPWAIGLMEARSQPGPATLALHEAVLRCLREAGFSVAETATRTRCRTLHLRLRAAGAGAARRSTRPRAARRWRRGR